MLRFENDALVTRYEYDKDGRKICQQDAEGYLTTWAYNAAGDVTQEYQYATRPSGNEALPPANSNDRCVEFDYDAFGQLVRKTLKNVRYQVFDAKSHRVIDQQKDLGTCYTYDALGNMTSMTDAKGQRSYCYYDVQGNLIAKINPKTDKGRAATTYTYDAFGQLTSAARHANGAKFADETNFELNAASKQDSTTSSVFDAFGHVIEQIDGMGYHTSFSYDANGNIAYRLQNRHQADGSVFKDEKIYLYDAENRQIQCQSLKKDDSHKTEDTRYNAFGEVIARGFNQRMRTFCEYDQLGRVWRSNQDGFWQIYVYSLDNNVTQIVRSSNLWDPLHHQDGADLSQEIFDTAMEFDKDSWLYELQRTDNEYDRLGHLIRQQKTSADKIIDNYSLHTLTETFERDRWGNMHTHTDAAGNTTSYKYNAFDQVIQQTLPTVSIMSENGTRRSIAPELFYAYDELGQAIALTDANGHTSAKVYDAEGHVVAEIDALGNKRKNEYNLLGQLSAKTNESGGTISYTYDKNDRLTSISGKTGNTYYRYDEAGQLIEQHNASKEYVRYWYDADNNLVQRQDERGYNHWYGFDDEGHMQWEKDALGHTKRWDYDAQGRVKTYTDLGGHTTTYTYNINGLLVEESSIDKNNNPLKHHTYTYRGNGQLRMFSDMSTGERIRFKYNELDQLSDKSTDKSGDYKHGWVNENDHNEYDALGRLVSVKRRRAEDTDNRLPPKNHELLAIQYEYDAVGNLRHSDITARYDGYNAQHSDDYYTYDANDRILINKGVLQNGEITISTTKGTELARDALGNIKSAREYQSGVLTDFIYHYNTAGQLEETHKRVNGKDEKLSARQYDKDGRLFRENRYDTLGKIAQTTEYNWDNGVLRGTTVKDRNDRLKSLSSIEYNELGKTKSESTTSYTNGNAVTLTHSYQYDALWDEAQRSLDNVNVYAGSQNSSGHSTYHYDVNGLLEDVIDQKSNVNGTNHTTHYWNSALEGLHAREDSSGITSYLIVNGHNIGDMHMDYAHSQKLSVYGGFSPEGSSIRARDFNIMGMKGTLTSQEDLNKEAPNAPQESLGSYLIQAGDSLEQIALNVFGDRALWYLIADANGLSDKNAPLQTGQRLTIPQASLEQHQNTGTAHKVDHKTLYGETSATSGPLPPPPAPIKHHHSLLKKVMVAVVSVAVGILTAGTLAALAQGLSNLTLGSIFSSGIGFMTGTGSTALGSTAALGISTTAGFAQSIAAQGLQTAFGMQNGIDLKSTLIGSLASAAGIGLTRAINQNLGLANTIRQGLDKLANPLFSLSSSAEMIEQNALTQSARIAMDNHQNFDFAELATSAIMAGIGGKSEDSNSMRNQIQQTTNSSVRHIAGNLTHAKLNTLLSGQRFNAEDVLVQSVANGMVDVVGAYYTTPMQQPEFYEFSSLPEDSIAYSPIPESYYEETFLQEVNETNALNTDKPTPLSIYDNQVSYDSESGGFRTLNQEEIEASARFADDEISRENLQNALQETNSQEPGFIDYVDGFNQGMKAAVEGTAANIGHLFLHPIETAKSIAHAGQMSFDGFNALADLTLGISTEGARQRNAQRAMEVLDGLETLSKASGPEKLMLATELSAGMLLGGGVASLEIGTAANTALKFVEKVPNKTSSISSRRSYFNEKFGRTGDLNLGINIRGRKEVATNFYLSQGFSKYDIPSHLTGIDFSKPLDIITINKGKKLFQFQTRGAPQGNYYSLSSEVTPSQLGISPSGFNRSLQLVEPKIQSTYVSNQKVSFLKSTAASVNDFWSVPGQEYSAIGGGIQLFLYIKKLFETIFLMRLTFMNTINIINEAIKTSKARLKVAPDFPIFQSIDAQLVYMEKLITGKINDKSKLNQINVGLYAVKELEGSDSEFADILKKVQYIADRMAKGLKIE